MHELSIVQSILDIATKEAHAAQGNIIDEIEIDIGALSGIDMNAFWFAWNIAVKNTLLANAKANIHHIEGMARCLMCEQKFAIQHYADPCPACGEHIIQVTSGKELRVKALTIS
jgi:hydrogenase nickel incorporation protein HypA/HybF